MPIGLVAASAATSLRSRRYRTAAARLSGGTDAAGYRDRTAIRTLSLRPSRWAGPDAVSGIGAAPAHHEHLSPSTKLSDRLRCGTLVSRAIRRMAGLDLMSQ